MSYTFLRCIRSAVLRLRASNLVRDLLHPGVSFDLGPPGTLSVLGPDCPGILYDQWPSLTWDPDHPGTFYDQGPFMNWDLFWHGILFILGPSMTRDFLWPGTLWHETLIIIGPFSSWDALTHSTPSILGISLTFYDEEPSLTWNLDHPWTLSDLRLYPTPASIICLVPSDILWRVLNADKQLRPSSHHLHIQVLHNCSVQKKLKNVPLPPNLWSS